MPKKILSETQRAKKNAYNARYHAEHREERLKKQKVWNANWNRANPDYQREYRKSHPPSAEQVQKSRDRSARNYREHPERIAATRERARKRIAAYMKSWRLANRDKVLAHKRNRYSRKRAGSSCGDRKLVAAFYRLVMKTRYMGCYWCGKRTTRRNRHIDHIVPLVRGGAHSVENLCCACIKCNLRKNALMPSEFSSQGELFLTPGK